MTTSLHEHWNQKYASSTTTQLGWYEEHPTPSLDYIERCGFSKKATILDVGSGATTLISKLIERGYENIFAADISSVALEKAKNLLNEEERSCVQWVVDDVANSNKIQKLENIALWHDRAVFHFLTEAEDRQAYFSLLKKVVMRGGYVIIATFALYGATHCSGLPVQRYSVDSLTNFLGEGFKLVEAMDHTYEMPSGDTRPFIYTRFQKV
jgi:SAM-dependent methyltransferase